MLPAAANRDFVLRAGQNNPSMLFNSDTHDSLANRNAPHQPNVAYQLAPRQPYQSNPSYRGYQKSNKKGIYQIRDENANPHLEDFYTFLEPGGKELQY